MNSERLRSANVTVLKVYKGNPLIQETDMSAYTRRSGRRKGKHREEVQISHFGIEDRDSCVASENGECLHPMVNISGGLGLDASFLIC